MTHGPPANKSARNPSGPVAHVCWRKHFVEIHNNWLGERPQRHFRRLLRNGDARSLLWPSYHRRAGSSERPRVPPSTGWARTNCDHARGLQFLPKGVGAALLRRRCLETPPQMRPQPSTRNVPTRRRIRNVSGWAKINNEDPLWPDAFAVQSVCPVGATVWCGDSRTEPPLWSANSISNSCTTACSISASFILSWICITGGAMAGRCVFFFEPYLLHLRSLLIFGWRNMTTILIDNWQLPVVPRKAVAEVSKIGNL